MSPGAGTAPVAVIGAGWAGLTAALALARAGVPVHLIEAGATPGGRARSLTLDDTPLDNGQHILVGACQATLAQMRAVGADPDRCLQPLPFGLRMHAPGQTHPALTLEPRSPRMPALAKALWHSLAGHPAGARWRAVLGAGWMLRHPPDVDMPVQEWLERHRQPPTMIHALWEPLCLAIMNTPLRRASASVFQHVLAEALGHGPDAARLLIPTRPLGALFPEPAIAELRALGATIELGRRIQRIAPAHGSSYRLYDRRKETSEARAIILATAPAATARLLPETPDLRATRQAVVQMGTGTICTVYLRYARALSLPPLQGLLDQHGQWLIPRALTGAPHWLAVVISAADDLPARAPEQRWREVAAALQDTFPELGFPLHGHAICERRATLDARVGIDRLRPAAATPWPGLYLAGDYLTPGLPSTLEAAVRSGLESAHKLLENLP
ncbi:MAG: hydroxysqualene dehydroxylase HpnE [Pseudomonadota bacterium]